MFDLATRPQPYKGASASVGVPFDLRLTRPQAGVSHAYTEYVTPTAVPAAGVEVLAVHALALEDTLQTAVILSLFTDRRAGPDDVLPFNQVDRRGWVGEEFFGSGGSAGEAWGSALWLVYASKTTGQVLERARFAAVEALQWLVRDGIASRIEVETLWVGDRGDRLAVRPQIYKPDQVRPVYDVLWGTTITRGPAE